eukprot:3021679-Amphidinium_carterae.1
MAASCSAKCSSKRSPESCALKRRPVGNLLLSGCPMGPILTSMGGSNTRCPSPYGKLIVFS